MRKIGNLMRWIVGVILILAGISSFSNAVPFALCCLLCGAAILPLIWDLLEKSGSTVKSWIKVFVPIIFFVFTLITAPPTDDSEPKAKSTQAAVEATAVPANRAQKSAEVKQTAADAQTVRPTDTPVPKSDLMEVHFLDVGQADAVLVKTEAASMLIDAGKNEDGDAVVQYIQQQGITKLDYMIGTHPHEDHIGGMDVVINSLDIGTVILPEKTHTSQTFLDVLTAIDNKGLEITLAHTGDEYPLGSAKFTILAPNADYGDNLNNWSVGLKLQNGNNNFVFTGDAESQAEEDILSTGIDLKADVFKAGHHGSETSNIDAVLEAVSPAFTVISCGKDNQYGHPDLAALERFQRHNIQIFRTDEQGTIIATSDGTNIGWSAQPSTTMTPGTKQTEDTNEDNEPENLAATPVPAEAPAAQNTPVEETPVESPATTGVSVHITETGGKYHSAGCRYLKDSDIEIALSDAQAQGYEPCSKCNPPR